MSHIGHRTLFLWGPSALALIYLDHRRRPRRSTSSLALHNLCLDHRRPPSHHHLPVQCHRQSSLVLPRLRNFLFPAPQQIRRYRPLLVCCNQYCCERDHAVPAEP